MAKTIESEEIQTITECSLYNDPRVLYKSHTFCVNCLEETRSNSCQLCRPFYAIPDDGNSDTKLVEKLVNLHHLYVERRLNVTGEKVFDIPLVEEFKLARVKNLEIEIAWLENKIYVTYIGIKRIRVFADQAPFHELPEGIEMPKIVDPNGMAASAVSRSLFISDAHEGSVWRMQLPRKTISEIKVGFEARQVAITPNDELLVVVKDFYENNLPSFRIDVHQLSDNTRTKSFLLPREVIDLTCAAQSPNTNFVISYSRDYSFEFYWITILSSDGQVIWTFDPTLFESIVQNLWRPYYFAITENGDIFFIETRGGRVYLFNSEMTDYQIMAYNNYTLEAPCRIVYIKEKQQLLVHEDRDGLTTSSESHLSIFHLGPCNLIQLRNDEEVIVRKITRKRKAFNFTSKYNKYNKLRFQKKLKI